MQPTRNPLSALVLCLSLVLLLSLYTGAESVTRANSHFQPESPLATPHVQITRHLNIRHGPGVDYDIIAVVRPGERYAITGRNVAGTWLRIDYNVQPAWLYAPLVQVIEPTPGAESSPTSAPETTPPPPTETAPAATPDTTTDTSAPAPSDAATVRTVRAMNIRGGPGTNFDVITTAPADARFRLTGQNAAGTWWRIDYNGQTAWLYAALVEAANAADVPTVNAPAPPTTSSASPAAAGFDPQRVQIRLQPVFSGLEQPTHITHADDGSGRLFVSERPGRIRVYPGPNADGQIFLDITDRVDTTGPEQGLLGLAFSPTFASDGYFFVNYTNNGGDTLVARYRVSADPNRADRESEFTVLFQEQPAPNHNGGMILFGPDNYLWIGLGDGGGAHDTYRNGQNPGTLLGAMLRLDVLSDPSVPYTVPPDNPWTNATLNGLEVRDEIWAIGLRNPWRYSFDRRSGDLWIGDVGQNQIEEINYVPVQQVARGGLNFSWPFREAHIPQLKIDEITILDRRAKQVDNGASDIGHDQVDLLADPGHDA